MFYGLGFIWSSPSELLSVSKDKWFIKQDVRSAYRPVDLLKRNGMGWNIQGDIAFTVDKSSRVLFVDETILSKSVTDTSKNLKRSGGKPNPEEEVQLDANIQKSFTRKFMQEL